ncbi:MAG: hypothetical protein JST85_05295 [Acidobacteria bacterium]|nr:hypothetical protein [Acidobacteriota bacterium]
MDKLLVLAEDSGFDDRSGERIIASGSFGRNKDPRKTGNRRLAELKPSC